MGDPERGGEWKKAHGRLGELGLGRERAEQILVVCHLLLGLEGHLGGTMAKRWRKRVSSPNEWDKGRAGSEEKAQTGGGTQQGAEREMEQ